LARRLDLCVRTMLVLDRIDRTPDRLKLTPDRFVLMEHVQCAFVRHAWPFLTINRHALPGVPGVLVVASVATHNERYA
jgi:hypothetical protein